MAAVESPDFININNTSGSPTEEIATKTVKITEMARLSTPKPVLYLGSTTEFQRQGSALPKTPFKPGTGHRAATGFKPTTNFKQFEKPGTSYKPATGFRPGTGAEVVNRPMTAVRGAGYTSHGKHFDPLNQTSAAPTPPLELQKDDSPEQKIRQQKAKIMQLVEEACIAECEGDFRKALAKAKEASNKERVLIKMQEQSDLGDLHDVDLTFVVLFTLGNQYAANELYTEALSTYQMIIKNRMFSNAHRLKINMGNIYFKQGQYQMAVKMYRMALDQVSSSQKNLRIKIMHNIALVFIRMGQWEEAISSLEYIMSEQACHKAGLDLVICCRALEDRDRMKTAFSMLLNVPLDIEDDEKYHLEQDNPEDVLIAIAIQNDNLHKYEQKKCKDAEYCILTAAKLIAPLIENTFSMGYDWCVASIKNSEYARLASDLEINKAVMFLKQNQLAEAIDTLKAFEKDSVIAINAAVNLSFIYYLQGDIENATKYAQVVETSPTKSADGFVNLGACMMAKNQLDEAIACFRNALELDATHFEAIYDLGLVLKKQGHYSEALQCFQRFSGSLALLPTVVYQIANLLELKADSEAAADMYQQLLGLVPSDSGVLQKIGELYDHDGDKQQAHHYHIEGWKVTDSLGIRQSVTNSKSGVSNQNKPVGNGIISNLWGRCNQFKLLMTVYKPWQKYNSFVSRTSSPHNYSSLENDVLSASSFRYYPANLPVINWLGSYYIEMQVVEKALVYFEKAALMQPNQPKWNMMVAGCHRRSGNMHKALTLYQEINRQFPDNVECLRFLVRLCNDMGMREAQDYILELKKLEKAKEVRERVNSSRPSSRRSNSGLSSRAGSGFSPVPEHAPLRSPLQSANRNLRSSRFINAHNSAGSTDSGFGQPTIDASYSDPLGPQPARPRTGAGKPLDFDDFGNDVLGDDLLPE